MRIEFWRAERGRRSAVLGTARPTVAAYTRLDVAVLVAVVALVAAWFGFMHLGERGRTASCAHNLAELGQAMHSFANDHTAGLPPASIQQRLIKWDAQQTQTSWDMLLRPYLRPDLVVSNSPYADRQLELATAPRLCCPSDPFLRAQPRSYAMSRHDMRPENWPPGPHNTTGVGLRWSKAAMLDLLGAGGAASAATNLDALTLVSLSWLPAPADTLLLGELQSPANTLWNPDSIGFANAAEQMAAFKGNPSLVHRGRFNYLMTDGHVELMSPMRTGNAGGTGGIWTIEPGD